MCTTIILQSNTSVELLEVRSSFEKYVTSPSGLPAILPAHHVDFSIGCRKEHEDKFEGILDRTAKSDPHWGSLCSPYIPHSPPKSSSGAILGSFGSILKGDIGPYIGSKGLGSDFRVRPKTFGSASSLCFLELITSSSRRPTFRAWYGRLDQQSI